MSLKSKYIYIHDQRQDLGLLNHSLKVSIMRIYIAVATKELKAGWEMRGWRRKDQECMKMMMLIMIMIMMMSIMMILMTMMMILHDDDDDDFHERLSTI